MDERTIEEFWNSHPCGESQVDAPAGDYEAFFRRYDTFRYRQESHILRRLDAIDFNGKRVLEIGLGQGSESEQIIRRGGRWTGIDLTQTSVDRVSTRLRRRGLDFERIVCGSVLELPFDTHSFDLVFSHGVLHHVPDIRSAQAEIARVLAPSGRLVIMVYAKLSLNYLISIALLRRLGLVALYTVGVAPPGILGDHVRNAKKEGLLRYLKMDRFIHRNTDGPFNPYSKVYTVADVRADFPSFVVDRAHKEHMHAPPLPVGWLPGARFIGWHLWVHLKPRRGETE